MQPTNTVPVAGCQSFLESCITSLMGHYEKNIAFLRAYNYILINRLLHEYSSSTDARPSSEWKEAASYEWRAFVDSLVPDSVASILPTSEAIRTESLAFLHAYRGPILEQQDYDWFLATDIEWFGLSLNRTTVLVFQELRTITLAAQWIDVVLANRPIYVDMPGNLNEQLGAREQATLNIFIDLHRTIAALQLDPIALCDVVDLFGPIVLSAANYAWSLNTSLMEESIDHDVEAIVKSHRAMILDPLSEIPLRVRQQMAQVNIRGTFRLLLHDAVELANNSSPLSELHWRLFQKFVNGLYESASAYNCVDHVREALVRNGLDEFFDTTALPVLGWTCQAFEDILEPEDAGDDDINYDDLPHEYFEPSGPDMRVEHHAIAVTMASVLSEQDCSICRDMLNIYETSREEVPVKVECAHCFHYGCLTTLINGIANYSNSCPNCRKVICPSRKKCLKDTYKFYERLAPLPEETETMVEVKRDPLLCDKEGDVVMTDN
ncbi:hypothetical protein CC86DRAFT_377514 [Ophiobolus disseminans]|uniref:RING-type domain-containing protein n=1 Tax=Ophiobolus disseminans TaxID=1469910 RepID=A0A6A7AGC2_9PLEO|nr:hypothetical protein CC86DRAFT_377514 [Ophiobolus disseminans]